MLKNFGKVFRFTFRHQTESAGYRLLTILIAVVLFAAPVVGLVIADKSHEKHKEKKLKFCGAERVVFADPYTEQDNFFWLSAVAAAAGEEEYSSIKYEAAPDAEAALTDVKSKGEKKTLVVVITKEDESLSSKIIIPEGSEITKKQAGYLEDFLDKNSQFFSILASGLSVDALTELSFDQKSDVFDETGYGARESLFVDSDAEREKNNEEILKLFRMIMIYISMFVVYFIVLNYGAAIMNCVVMEKTSKLMDTMLISVSPEAMVFGKMLGVLLAGVIQLLAWALAVLLGFIAGYQVVMHMNPDSSQSVILFLKSVGDMGVFTPGRITVAIIVLCFSVVLYSTMATIGGAISSTKEEVASNQSLFVIVLVIAFFVVMAKGMGETVPAWMCLCPFTAAMALPGAAAGGSVSLLVSVLGLLIMTACSILFVYLAGKMYKMMALYKGNNVNYGKAFRMLLNMKDKEEKA